MKWKAKKWNQAKYWILNKHERKRKKNWAPKDGFWIGFEKMKLFCWCMHVFRLKNQHKKFLSFWKTSNNAAKRDAHSNNGIFYMQTITVYGGSIQIFFIYGKCGFFYTLSYNKYFSTSKARRNKYLVTCFLFWSCWCFMRKLFTIGSILLCFI